MRRTFLLVCWVIADYVLFVGAYTLGYLAKVQTFTWAPFPIGSYLRTVVIIAPFWLLVLVSLRVFTLTRIQQSRKNILHILFACAMGVSFFTLAFYFLNDKSPVSRLLLVYVGTFSFLLTTLWHTVFDVWQRKVLRKDPPAYPLLLIGINRDTERIIKLLNDRESVFKPVAILDSRGTSAKEIAGVPVLGRLHKLEETIREKRITHLMQCAEIEHTINLLSVCRAHKLTYLLLPSVLGIVGVNEKNEQIEGQSVIMVG